MSTTTIRRKVHLTLPTIGEEDMALARFYGYPDGLVPLDVHIAGPHREAVYAVHRPISVWLEFEIVVDQNGTRTVTDVKLCDEPEDADKDAARGRGNRKYTLCKSHGS